MIILQFILTFIVGLIAAYIAWLQWKLAHNKLRLDLFDRRYKVYDATRRFLIAIDSEADFSNTQLFNFTAETSDAIFLFNSDVIDYLELIKNRSIEMRLKEKNSISMQDGNERSRLIEENAELLLWLSEEIKNMKSVFSPYLDFSHINKT